MDPDFELIKQCKSDDPVAFEKAFSKIYNKYGERAFNISFRILGNAEEAQDVTQDAFITLFKKLGQFRSDSRFYTWFYRIVVNLCIDRKRKLGSVQRISDTDMGGALSEVPDSKSITTEDLVRQDFLESKIQAALLRLSPNLRLVTVLRYIEALSYAEIADTLECSIGTVKSRLNRAHKNLETILKSVIDSERKVK